MIISTVWQRTAFLRSGTGLTIMVAAFVALRLLWIQLDRPTHMNQIAAAFGSSSLFHGAPRLNQKGDQFAFVKTSAHGYSLFLGNVDTGQIKSLCELNNYLGHNGDDYDLQALPWSPDDSLFLYASNDELLAYSPNDETSFRVASIRKNSISDLVWLNSSWFAYIDESTNLYYIEKEGSGLWEKHRVLSRPSQMSSLAAIGDDEVAWLEDNSICRVNLHNPLPGTNSIAAANISTNDIELPTNGLALWLDASTLKQPNKSPVRNLPDLSLNGNDALWNGSPPIFNATNSPNALNKRATIHFASLRPGTNGMGLAVRPIADLAGSAPRSIFVVMRPDKKRSMMVSMGDTRRKGALFSVEYDYDSVYLPNGWRKADNRIKMASTQWEILEVIYDGKSQMGYVNGILRGMATNQLNTMDKEMEIGLRTPTWGENGKTADGDFAELLVYDRPLDFADRKQVEGYLTKKWFQNKLPGKKPAKKNGKPLPEVANGVPVAPNPFIWFTPDVEGLTDFSYSKDNGEFLLASAEGQFNFLWQYDPQTENLSQIQESNSLLDEQWFGDGESAYYVRDFKRGGIIMRDSNGTEEGRELPGVDVLWFQARDDGQIMVLGTVSNTPAAGIWQYDIASKKSNLIVPYSDEPSVYAKRVTPTNIVIRVSSGESLKCTVYVPRNFNPHKKYPLLIGDTVFTDAIYRYQGPDWAPAIANCGGYVVIVERRGWFGKGLQTWGPDVLTAYNQLTSGLHIDTSQVYLFGSSAETSELSDFVTDSPGLWKGLILLNPSDLPYFTKSPRVQSRPKILISVGGDEDEDNRLKQYQRDSFNSGVIVEYVVHPGEGHHLVGDAAQLARTQAIMHFIFEE